MSIEVTIRQKGLFAFQKKTLPFQLILGDILHYGTYEKVRMRIGKHEEGDFTAYIPDAIGRGIDVKWSSAEKQQVRLTLATPCHDREITELFNMVKRIAGYWNCTVQMGDDAKATPVSELEALMEAARIYNQSQLAELIDMVLSDEESEKPYAQIRCAMWPLALRLKEAEYFAERPDHFSHWLHRAQVMDAYYCYPDFYRKEDGTVEGQYIFMEGIQHLLPYRPVHFDRDNKTGRPIQADEYRIFFFGAEDKDELVDLPYDVFIQSIDTKKAKAYDALYFWMEELTRDELMEIYRKGRAILKRREIQISDWQ